MQVYHIFPWVNMSTQLLLEIVPGIDAILASFHGKRNLRKRKGWDLESSLLELDTPVGKVRILG